MEEVVPCDPWAWVRKDHTPELPCQKLDYPETIAMEKPHKGPLMDSPSWVQPMSQVSREAILELDRPAHAVLVLSHLRLPIWGPSHSRTLESWPTYVLFKFLNRILLYNKMSVLHAAGVPQTAYISFWETAITFSGILKANWGGAIKKLQFNKLY